MTATSNEMSMSAPLRVEIGFRQQILFMGSNGIDSCLHCRDHSRRHFAILQPLQERQQERDAQVDKLDGQFLVPFVRCTLSQVRQRRYFLSLDQYVFFSS